MTNNDYIKPVESLQNIASVTPAKDRQEKKKQQNRQQDHGKNDYIKDELNLSDQEDIEVQPQEIEIDKHSIDYRA